VTARAGGDVIYAADVNTRIATTPRTSDTSTVTTTETVSDTVTASLVSGEKYRVRWVVGYTSSVASDTLFLRIREDNVSGTAISLVRATVPTTNGAGSRWVEAVEAEYTAVATGSKTFVGTYVRASGTGNVKVAADATTPTYLYVDLIVGN
jgi:hypothetical protein